MDARTKTVQFVYWEEHDESLPQVTIEYLIIAMFDPGKPIPVSSPAVSIQSAECLGWSVFDGEGNTKQKKPKSSSHAATMGEAFMKRARNTPAIMQELIWRAFQERETEC